MTNEEIIDAIKKLQGAMSRAHDTMRQPTKYVVEAQAGADKAVKALRERTWVGLTDEEIKDCFKITPDQHLPWHIYQRIEAKLKEKNI